MADRRALPPRHKPFSSLDALREATVRQCLEEWKSLHGRGADGGPRLPSPYGVCWPGSGPWSMRHALIEQLDGSDVLGFGRACSPRELALCSLLAGNFPRVNLLRATVRGVIDDEERRIRKIRRDLDQRRGARPPLTRASLLESTA